MSGALYESILVVERSSTGAEILCLMVPAEKECFLEVRLLCGRSAKPSLDFVGLLVVKALERDISAECGRMAASGPGKMEDGSKKLPFVLTNESVGC